MKGKALIQFCLATAILTIPWMGDAQMITGIWKGKINRQKAEVKIVQKGDSLIGTSYYYESPDHYRRYSIRGYFDPNSNEAVWWDDQLIEEKSGNRSPVRGQLPLLSRADFNCPGSGIMMLDGKAGGLEDSDPKGEIHLDKISEGVFKDEWDFVLHNYLTGTNDPWIIDSIAAIAFVSTKEDQQSIPVKIPPATKIISPVSVPVVTAEEKQSTKQSLTIEQKFVSRKKVLVSEIPITGDSIELRFYDNAEIDGDSISLFLNDRVIFTHIRLLGSAYSIKLAVNTLNESNELTMVAENLGSIPPNTSLMIAVVGDKRYEARLESTEGSSAMIRLFKPPL